MTYMCIIMCRRINHSKAKLQYCFEDFCHHQYSVTQGFCNPIATAINCKSWSNQNYIIHRLIVPRSPNFKCSMQGREDSHSPPLAIPFSHFNLLFCGQEHNYRSLCVLLLWSPPQVSVTGRVSQAPTLSQQKIRLFVCIALPTFFYMQLHVHVYLMCGCIYVYACTATCVSHVWLYLCVCMYVRIHMY